ncbi:hypothetical protein [Reyranella soli]|nr:hypothetical protein [Reyranella soli]
MAGVGCDVGTLVHDENVVGRMAAEHASMSVLLFGMTETKADGAK